MRFFAEPEPAAFNAVNTPGSPNECPTGELTDTLYFPKMSQAKVAQLFGGSLTGLRVAAYGPDANFAWSYFESPITFIPHYNLDYIAVWGDE
ncbi:MAG: hypothetical protein IJJ20_06215 [Thermoguttaceae bacterium]|nr:hypothetical protein [Thermoguttaceae bacterium]